jgi:CheY-like chemotaxis protein
VASNLLTNAARYTNPGGDVWLTAFHADGQIEIHVRDSGIGMGPELLERVFEPFSQGAQEIDRAQGGLGLGLALVKTLTEAHGGTVEATSAGPGRGSELVVRLPVADSMDGIRPSLTPGRGVPAPAAGTRILVVDDNPDAAEVLARGLRRLGYQVGIAHDGPEALATAPELHPEIAILDIGLPVMDGYELGHRLRQLEGLDGLRLIAVTGYGQISDRMRSRAAGFDAHLVKPVGIEELAEALET